MLGAISLLIRSAGLADEKPTKKLSTSETLHAVLYKPTPEYPYSARRRHETGGGVFVLHIDDKTGLVTDVTIARTTGHADLNDAARAAFERWRVKPGTITKITVPVTFTFGGASVGGVVVSGGTPAMDRALASYLGKGTVLSGSGPIYPTSPPWTYKTGHGVYELHVAETGYVSTVKILKSSGDTPFDDAPVSALSHWRFAKAPLILELPLAFVLTPESFNVYVAR